MLYVVAYIAVLVAGFILFNADALYQYCRIDKYERYFANAQHFNGKGL